MHRNKCLSESVIRSVWVFLSWFWPSCFSCWCCCLDLDALWFSILNNKLSCNRLTQVVSLLAAYWALFVLIIIRIVSLIALLGANLSLHRQLTTTVSVPDSVNRWKSGWARVLVLVLVLVWVAVMSSRTPQVALTSQIQIQIQGEREPLIALFLHLAQCETLPPREMAQGGFERWIIIRRSILFRAALRDRDRGRGRDRGRDRDGERE